MKKCPSCSREFHEQVIFCPYDGHSLAIYNLLDDKYQLEEKIGQGGMGQVYKGTHLQLGISCAIKILHPDTISNQKAIERFRREARATAQIRHPNAVQVTDFGVTKDTGMAYLVMEFLEGYTLKEKLLKQTKLSLKEILPILTQTCAAVHLAHSKGIIHRDLKPDNIFIIKNEEGEEQVKVLDFGIAKLKDPAGSNTLTETGTVVGTPQYMSPEQCRSGDIDVRSDIYSLGIILYQMLAGTVPFSASSPSAVIIMQATEVPKPLSQFCPETPKQIENIILKALEKIPDKRQQTALELAKEFEIALYESGIIPNLFVNKQIDLIISSNTNIIVASPKGILSEDTQDNTLSHSTNQNIPTTQVMSLSEKEAFGISDSRIREKGNPSGKLQAHVLPATRLEIKPEDSSLNPKPEPSDLQLKQTIVETINPINNQTIKIKQIIRIVILLFGLGLGGWFFMSSLQKQTTIQSLNQPIKVPVTFPREAPAGMVFIPGGTFTMGNNSSDEDSEKPEHEVKVEPFYIDQYELTNEQYYEFIKATKHPTPTSWSDGKFPPGEDKYPVVNISWADAGIYAKWAGKRLPTEVEWEYSARGTDKRLYPWGNEFSPRNTNSKETAKNYAVPIGSYPSGASPFGVLDLAGNVAEWTSSDYQPYPNSKTTPQKGFKIIRGGSFFFDKTLAMVTTRFTEKPDVTKQFLGFRCAKDIQK